MVVSSSPFQGWPYRINSWVTSKFQQNECWTFLIIATFQDQTSSKALWILGGVLPHFVCKDWVKPMPLSVAGAKSKAKGFWVLVAQSCLTFRDPMDYSPPGFSVHVIFQERILEWAAISYSRGSSQPRDWSHISCISCFGRWIFTTITWSGTQKMLDTSIYSTKNVLIT